ncbi:uncharacterized protein [Taeniopygia guttata]|uniref:uncharacterized protein isoform X3 n=1 Tax=Taeniopygia guttata TaxID=59729 RepID=UPI003BB928B6
MVCAREVVLLEEPCGHPLSWAGGLRLEDSNLDFPALSSLWKRHYVTEGLWRSSRGVEQEHGQGNIILEEIPKEADQPLEVKTVKRYSHNVPRLKILLPKSREICPP